MATNLIDKRGKVNTERLNEDIRKQQEAFSYIDSGMAVLEKMPDLVDAGLDFLNRDSFNFVLNPMQFLFQILDTIGVEEEKLKEWLTELIVLTLPTVELGVKGYLLSKIKSTISCNFDPRIPWQLRKKVGSTAYIDILDESFGERGMDIALSSIDPEGILDLSPFTEPGLQYYFGQSEDINEDSNSKVAKLARADDFNAFIWYVINKGNNQNPIRINVTDASFIYGGETYNLVGNTSFKGVVEITCKEGKEFIAGTTFCNADNPIEILLCIKKEKGKNTLVPLSSDWESCNWYVDKSRYFKNNILSKDDEPRNYKKEKPICNLAYVNLETYANKNVKTPVGIDNIRFTILPKPAVIIPSIDRAENNNENGEVTDTEVKVNWKIVRLLFDADGTPNSKGKYSLPGEIQPSKKPLLGDDWVEYTFDGTVVLFNRKTGNYKLKNQQIGSKSLIECYPGLTVYEFNYDYIMGMRLFDPKTVCNRLLKSVTNSSSSPKFNLTLNRQKSKLKYPFISGKQRITEIIKKIIESNEEEYNDCFYSFSNNDYDEMLKKTAELKYNQSPYTEGYGGTIDLSEAENILAEYPQNGTLQEQKEVISHAIEAACASVEDSIPPEFESNKTSIRINFLTDMLKELSLCLLDSIMSPKILMIMAVNEQLMQEDGEEPITTEQLITLAKTVIVGLIKELTGLIMKKILDYILEYLTPLVMEIQALIASEQIQAYLAIIKLLMAYYNKGLTTVTKLNSIISSIASKLKNKNYDDENYEIPSVLDDVNYADILNTNNDSENTPIINNC